MLGGVHAAFEARDRVATAFDVREVGREHAHVVAGVRDRPARVLVRVRRDPHLALHVLARAQVHLLQPRLVLAERLVRGVERAHPARNPRRAELDHADAQGGMAHQHAVDDQRVQRLHDRQRDRQVVDRLEVRVAAVEVGHRRQTVVEEVGRHHVHARAGNVQHDRHTRLRARGPHRFERDVTRRVTGGVLTDPDRGAARVDRLGRERDRRRGVADRHDGDRQQARVDRAPVEHGAVLRARERRPRARGRRHDRSATRAGS